MARQCPTLARRVRARDAYFRSIPRHGPIVTPSSAPQAVRPSAAPSASSVAGKIDVAADIDRLWVVWGEPDDGTRRIVGELWRDAHGFAFAYGQEIAKA